MQRRFRADWFASRRMQVFKIHGSGVGASVPDFPIAGAFHRYAQPPPWLSPDDIEKAKIRNSANRQARLFHGEWLAENEGDALDSEVIDAAITLKGPTIKREDGWMVCTGVDLALTRDNSAVDPWQAAMLCERLDEKGVPVRQVSFTGGNLQTMASAVLESFNEGTIDLYNDKHLIADLRRLRVVEKSYGVRLASPHTSSGDGPGSAHGDVVTALALALLSARSHSHIPNRISRELVCFPQFQERRRFRWFLVTFLSCVVVALLFFNIHGGVRKWALSENSWANRRCVGSFQSG